MSDTTTLSGAEFRRHVGTDPAKWAEAFLAAVGGPAVGARSEAERVALVAQWFRDAMEAAVAEAVRHETAAICPPATQHAG
jgi:hypothetical protein